jgi:flagellar biosynthesis protein FliP
MVQSKYSKLVVSIVLIVSFFIMQTLAKRVSEQALVASSEQFDEQVLPVEQEK